MSSSSANLHEALKTYIDNSIRSKVEDGKFYSKYNSPTEAEIFKIAGGRVQEPELAKLKQLCEKLTRDAENKIAWPYWIEKKTTAMISKAEKLLEAKEFEKCRETVWKASTTGVLAVDEGIRKTGYEFLNSKVNPAEWRKIEKEMRDKALEFDKKKAWDEGKVWMAEVKTIREYSEALDGQLLNVRAELAKLEGVDVEKANPIFENTKDAMRKALKIRDDRDSTTNTVVSVTTRCDTEAYRKSLAELRQKLELYNCTKANAEEIIAAFKRDADPLIEALYTVETTEKKFPYLGTAAVNKRIKGYSERLSKWLENRRTLDKKFAELMDAGNVAAARKLVEEDLNAVIIEPQVKIVKITGKEPLPTPEELAFLGMELRWKARRLIKAEKYGEARELIWSAVFPEKKTVVSKYLLPIGKKLMLEEINPANWAFVQKAAKEVAEKAKESGDIKQLGQAKEFVDKLPLVKVYASEIDEKLQKAGGAAAGRGADSAKIQAAVFENETETEEVANIADYTDKKVKRTVAGKCTKVAGAEKLFAEALEEYRKALLKNDCTGENAEMLVKKFRMSMEVLIKEASSGASGFVMVERLGCNALNKRIKGLKEEEAKSLQGAIDKIKADEAAVATEIAELSRKVAEFVLKKDFASARKLIAEASLSGNSEHDARKYAIRIGLLNCVVNPHQFEFLQQGVNDDLAALFKTEKYEELVAYPDNYKYVEDAYGQIVAALETLKGAMTGMKIGEKPADAYITGLAARIKEMLEKREGSYLGILPEQNLEDLEKTLRELHDALLAQYYDSGKIRNFRELVKAEVCSLANIVRPSMTTYELNLNLREYMTEAVAEMCAELKDRVDRRNYCKLLAAMDEEVSFDAQIAMAEVSISRQTGICCEKAKFGMNAVLGDYARILRLMKREARIAADEATTLLAGAAYMRQPAMFKRAIELGAAINGRARRDPLGRTALLVAIERGHYDFVELALDAGADLKATDANGNTALHYAVKSGNLLALKALAQVVDLKSANKDGETAVFIAARRNQALSVKCLLGLAGEGAKAYVLAKNASGKDVFTVACEVGANAVLDMLFEAGSEFGTEHLVEAAKANRLAIAQWLVDHGADVNGEGVMAAAFGSSEDGDTETYRYLVSQGGIAPKRAPKKSK